MTLCSNCEMYQAAKRDAEEAEAYAEELEVKLADQAHLIGQFFALLNVTEESDEGRTFRPNVITSCRVADAEKLEHILIKLKGFIND